MVVRFAELALLLDNPYWAAGIDWVVAGVGFGDPGCCLARLGPRHNNDFGCLVDSCTHNIVRQNRYNS